MFICWAIKLFTGFDWVFVHFALDTVPVRTVNRQCSSGLQAVADVAACIKAGFYDIGQNISLIYVFQKTCIFLVKLLFPE